MSEPASPATQLRAVLVVQDQTRAEWHAGKATIRNGRIIIVAGRADPPAGLFSAAAATYSIQAVDGADRRRSFANLALSRDSHPPQEYVFD